MRSPAQRPRPLPQPGQRVVLVVHRGDLNGGRGLSRVLDEIAGLGWLLTAVIEPVDHLKALQMVLDGLADVVLATRADDLPSLKFTYDLGKSHGRPLDRSGRAVRTVPTPDHPSYERGRQRRPGIVHAGADLDVPGEVPEAEERRSRMARRPNRMAG